MITNALAAGTLDELLAHARQAHESIRSEPAAALARAFEAGDALTAAKARVERGTWSTVLASTGIPASTARLYIQLARERERILAAGCQSIREARRLLAGTMPRGSRRTTGSRARADGSSDRYEEGYADGYRAGRADGASASRPSSNGGALPLDRKDVRWLVSLAHPDKHQGDLRATRVTQWLNELAEEAPAT